MLNNAAFVYTQGGYGSAPPPPDNAPPPPPPGEQPPPPPGGSAPPLAPGADSSADAYSAYWYVLIPPFIDPLPVCSPAVTLSHTPCLQILGHSLGMTSIRHSLKNGRRISNNSTVSTMLSRGMGLVVHRVHQGDLLHRRMEFPHRHRRLHSSSPSPGAGFGASMCDNCCNDFLSSLLYFNV